MAVIETVQNIVRDSGFLFLLNLLRLTRTQVLNQILCWSLFLAFFAVVASESMTF